MARGEPLPLPFWPEARRWTAGEAQVASFLWTCPERAERGREGLFEMTPEGVAEGLPESWGLVRVLDALALLDGRGWVLCDRGWMFIPSALEHVTVRGNRTVAAAVNRVKDAPRESPLWRRFVAAAREHAPQLYSALNLASALGQLGANGCPKLAPNAEGELGASLPQKEAENTGELPQPDRARRMSAPAGGGARPGVRDTTPVNPLWLQDHRRWRIAEGLTIEQCAERYGVSTEAVERMEDGTVEFPRVGGVPSLSSAEPHGNAPGGDADAPAHVDGEGAAA